MSFLTQLYTNTLSNQNIATALLVGTFTNTTRIRKLYVEVSLDQIAGNGNYTCYATRQRAGAGSAYQKVPITTAAVASGVTAIDFDSIAIILNATDVLKVYVLGLAGDTTTPDIIVDVNEEFILTDALGVVSANVVQWLAQAVQAAVNGFPKVDLTYILGTILSESAGAGALSAAFIKFLNVISPTGTVNSLPDAPPDAAGGLSIVGSQMNLKDTALTAIENKVWDAWQADHIAVDTMGASLNDAASASIPTVQQIVDGVWDEILANHLDAGSTGEALSAASTATVFPSGANEVTITVNNSITSLPIDGATVWITTDLAGTNTIWAGSTDAFGVARNVLGEKPFLNTGTYYGWIQDSAYTDSNPRTLNVSP